MRIPRWKRNSYKIPLVKLCNIVKMGCITTANKKVLHKHTCQTNFWGGMGCVVRFLYIQKFAISFWLSSKVCERSTSMITSSMLSYFTNSPIICSSSSMHKSKRVCESGIGFLVTNSISEKNLKFYLPFTHGISPSYRFNKLQSLFHLVSFIVWCISIDAHKQPHQELSWRSKMLSFTFQSTFLNYEYVVFKNQLDHEFSDNYFEPMHLT